MSRPKREREENETQGPGPAKELSTGLGHAKEKENDELVFEDQFEDDFDSEDDMLEVMGGEELKIPNLENGDGEEEDEGEKGESEEEEEEEEVKKVWNPVEEPLKPGEKLEFDNNAYDMIHFIGVEWPCLSFDILEDKLGFQRTQFPHQMYIVAGTQAGTDDNNSLILLKLSDLNCTKHDEDSEGDDDEDIEGVDDEPILENRNVPHPSGSINKIRSMPQNPHIVAAMSSCGHVNVYDLSHHLAALDKPLTRALTSLPIYVFKGHPVEGWALNWSPNAPGRLATGDCNSHIYLWDPVTTGLFWNIDKIPFSGHTASVEDLCWSPTEGDVFASCSVDGTIKLWDSRKGKKNVANINAHTTDVNVISWNHKRAFLLLSGADDGNFKVWDLRKLGPETPYQFSFNWHSGPITSVEWNPNDDAELAVASADNSVTVWDLSLTTEKAKVDGLEIPSQLLFVHQGQEHIKEVHWHKQIPGVLISTAMDGFNVFKPANIFE